MDKLFWQRQTGETPLFPDLLWSRPQHKQAAGKLLIIGGHAHSLSVPAEAYTEALKNGAGRAVVLLPDATKKLVGNILEDVAFAPSTPSGSFSRAALATFIDESENVDGVMLAGDLGHNSETAVLLESYIDKLIKPLVLSRDSIDYFNPFPGQILERPNTVMVLSIAQLQKLASGAKFTTPILFNMDLVRLVDALHTLTTSYPAGIVVKHLDTVLVAWGGKVSTTKTPAEPEEMWRTKTAAAAAVWWLQSPGKPFEALTTAVYEVNKSS